ncbi:MAG: hypothetical protein U0Q11_24460 [Vicinamibacterales bacterium]
MPLIIVGLALVGSGVDLHRANDGQQFHWRGNGGRPRTFAVGLYSAAYYLGGSLGGMLPSVFWDTGGWTLCVMLVLAVQAVTLGTALVAWRPARA